MTGRHFSGASLIVFLGEVMKSDRWGEESDRGESVFSRFFPVVCFSDGLRERDGNGGGEKIFVRVFWW